MGWLKYIFKVLTSWYQSHKCFNKAIAFLSAVLISRRWVEYGITRLAVTYLDNMVGGNIKLSAGLDNMLDGLSSVLVLALTYISDAWTGRFRMVLYTSFASTIGCWLFLIAHNFLSLPILILSLLFLAKHTEAYEITVTAFLGDQMGNQQDPDQVVVHAMFWSRLCKFVGTLAFVIGISKLVGSVQLIFVAAAMTVGVIAFLCGFRYYNLKPPVGSSLDDVLPVLKAAHFNLHLNYPKIPTEFHENDGDELQLTPHMIHFRWLDKAAIIQVSPTIINSEEQERRGMLCPVQQVKNVKSLLSMFPMWITFLVYCIVSATGDTFYVLQGDKMLGTSVDFGLLFAIQSLMESISKGLSEFCLRKVQHIWPDARPRAWKVNMIVGMICGFLSCFIALLVEQKRLQLYNKGEYDKESEIVRMHIYCLFPQFIFLGIMHGLCYDAFCTFYEIQVPESMKSYGPPFYECVLGTGKFFSIFLLVAFMRWFGRTVNDSRLDHYYTVVAILSLLSSIPFHYFSNWPLYDGAIDHPHEPIKEIQLCEIISKQKTSDS